MHRLKGKAPNTQRKRTPWTKTSSMHFSSAREDFFKAHVQNHYEKVRCDLYIKEVTKRHVHSLTNINKSIQEARDALRDIRASSGYCKERGRTVPTAKSNVWKEREWSAGASRPNGAKLRGSEMGAKWKASAFRSKDLDSGREPAASKTGVSHSSVLYEKTERNVLDGSEYFVHGKNGAGRGNTGSEMNGDRVDIVSAGRLLRDEILTLPDSRNVSSGDTKGTSRQRMDSKEPQGKNQVKSKSSANGGNSQNADSSSGQDLGFLTSPDSALVTCKFGISRPNTGNGGLVGYRSQTAPEKASRLKSQVKSAAELKNSRSRYSAASDAKNVKIHVSLSRSERKKILQDLISTCVVPCDRSVLEREQQRRLQEKIHRFFELLFAQDDKGDKDDEGDIFDDD